jgi:tetratricopeptide (TPR) repeat protein
MNQDELKVLEERIKANPKSRSFLQLAEAYIEAGRRSEAIELLKNGEDYYPYYLAARITYGRLLREEGDADKAIEQFEFVNRTIPDNLLALKNLAHLYTEKDRLSEARTSANAVLSLSPNDPEMVELLSVISSREKVAPAPSPPFQTVAQTQEEEPVQAVPVEPMPIPPSVPELEEPESPAEKVDIQFSGAPPEEAPADLLPEPEPEPEPVPEPAVPEEPALKETSPEPEEPPVQVSSFPEEAEHKEPGLPQTETMGDLLFDQGHSEDALSVYENALQKDPDSRTLPQKIRTVKMALRKIPAEEPAPQPLVRTVPEPKKEPVVMPEPTLHEEVSPAPPKPEAVAVSSPKPMPAPSRIDAGKLSADDSLPERIIALVSSRMTRHLVGYVLSTSDGFSLEASDSERWADILAADGVEVVRIVSDMTRILEWGDFRGTIVWVDRAILYGIPIEESRVLFLVLKPEANIGLCRLLVQQASRNPETDGERR